MTTLEGKHMSCHLSMLKGQSLMRENLNIIDKNVRVLEKIVDSAENNLITAINNACNVKTN